MRVSIASSPPLITPRPGKDLHASFKIPRHSESEIPNFRTDTCISMWTFPLVRCRGVKSCAFICIEALLTAAAVMIANTTDVPGLRAAGFPGCGH